LSIQDKNNIAGVRKPLRSLRTQILSIAVIGTLGLFLFLAITLFDSKDHADLLKDIRDIDYPIQENLIAALHDLKFIDSDIEQASLSANTALLDHSMILAAEFRSRLQDTMVLDQDLAPEISTVLEHFEFYFRKSHTLAQEVASGKKFIHATTTAEKQENAKAFNAVVQSLGDLQTRQKNALITSADSVAKRASESVRLGLWTGIITVALLFLIALVTTGSISKRINSMVSSLRDIATGNRDMDVRIPLTGADEMTELAYWFNRRMFINCLNTEIDRLAEEKQDKQLAVMFLDLDNFKPVNDQLGHDAGDELIRIVAQRLVETIRVTDTLSIDTNESCEHEAGQAVVARLAGDEFMMVVTDIDSPEQVESVAHRIKDIVTKPISISGMEFTVGVSIGICMHPSNADDANSLVTCADIAMYEAKNSGKNTYRFYDPALRAATDRKIQIDSAIKSAIEQDEFHLLFQPKFRLSDNRLVGAEALLRWNNKELGEFTAEDFIAHAVASGMICELDDWVIAAVLEQLVEWDRIGLQQVEIALNFSAQQASRHKLGHAIDRITQDNQHLINQIEIEITEASAIDNIEVVEQNILELKDRGFKIAMDDFGAGHSSLTLLTRCPIDTLKIDKQVTTSLCNDEKCVTLVQSLIDLARNLNVAVCAEGVEDEEQVETLTRLNCDFAQGYFFSEPLTAKQFKAFLEMQSRGLDHAA